MHSVVAARAPLIVVEIFRVWAAEEGANLLVQSEL